MGRHFVLPTTSFCSTSPKNSSAAERLCTYPLLPQLQACLFLLYAFNLISSSKCKLKADLLSMHHRLCVALLSMQSLTTTAFCSTKKYPGQKPGRNFPPSFSLLAQKRQSVAQGQVKVSPFPQSYRQIADSAQERSCKWALYEMRRSDDAL